MQDFLIDSFIAKDIRASHNLAASNDFTITKILESNEKVIFSGFLTKINKHSASQKRFLVITNKNIYNIYPQDDIISSFAFQILPHIAIRRKIPIDKIYGVTIGSDSLSTELIINVTDDYYYRYDAGDQRDNIIKAICEVYIEYGKRNSLPLYIVEERHLTSFHTTDDDFKAGISKKPMKDKIEIIPEMIENGLEWVVRNREGLRRDTKEFWRLNKGNVKSNHKNPEFHIERNPNDEEMGQPCPNPEDVDDFVCC